ncbi:MAG: hypothetical protein DRN17_07420 [Thermoplasmata archaeon]|nr:MAG: hypothetical protein DRN17_07420 [Thermoplasmata archaeon]
MNIETLQEFLFWCMIINIGIYSFTALAVMVLPNFIYKILNKIFGLDRESFLKSIYAYLASYKLLITFFNFVPWVAIWIIK